MPDISHLHTGSPLDPFSLIRMISQAIDYGEITHDPYAFIKARKLLNNDLVEVLRVCGLEDVPWELLHHPLEK